MRTYLRAQLLIFALTWQSCEPGERPPNHCKTIATANARLRFELCRPPTRHATARHKPRDTPPHAARLHAASTPQGPNCQPPPAKTCRRWPKKMRPRFLTLAANRPPQSRTYKAAKSARALSAARSKSATKPFKNGANWSFLKTHLAL